MEEVLDQAAGPAGELKYECGICLRDFTSSPCLQTHIQTHKHDTHSCDQCGMTFPGFPELDEHLTSFHADANANDSVIATADEDTKLPMEELDVNFRINTKNPPPGESIWSIDPRDLPTEGNTLNNNLGTYPLHCNESFEKSQSDCHQKKSSKFSCRICDLYFENRNHLLRHLKLTNNVLRKEDHLMLDAEANKKLSAVKLRSKRGMRSMNESSKSSQGKERQRCRVCKVQLPQCKKLRRAHIRKHLLVKLNKRVYHVWKYLKTPRKEGLKSDVHKPNLVRTSKKPSIENHVPYDITPPVSDEDGIGNKLNKDIPVKPSRDIIGGEDTGLKKRKHRNILLRCFLCGEKFPTKTGLENHFQIVHGGMEPYRELEPLPHNKMSSWFTCSACGKKVHGKEKFKNHLTEHSLTHVSFKQKCYSDFTAGKSPNKGSKHFSKGPWFTCTECGKLCKGKKSIEDHANRFHRIFGNENTDQMPSKPSAWRRCCNKPSCAWYVCNTCSKRFKGKARITSHVPTCSGAINEDDAKLDTEGPKDIERKAPVPISNLPNCSWFACQLCKVKVHGRKRMIQHYDVCKGVIERTNKEKRPADRCENFDKNPAGTPVEERPASPEHDTAVNPRFTKYKCGPWFRCLVCDKLIKGKSNLKDHRHSAGKEKQKHLQTEDTGQNVSFTSKSGVNFSVCWCWYHCELCGLKIRGMKNADLHRHSEDMMNRSRNTKPDGELQMTDIHSSESEAGTRYDSDKRPAEKILRDDESTRPNFVQYGVWYRCLTCSVAVRGKEAMWTHSHETSDVEVKGNGADSSAKFKNTWSCSLCAKLFATKKSLLLHMKNHTECQEYKCRHCNKVFLTKSGFKLHQHIYGKDHSLVDQDKPAVARNGTQQADNGDDSYYIVLDESLGDNGPEQTPRQGVENDPKDLTNVMRCGIEKGMETSSDLPPLDFYGKPGSKIKNNSKCCTRENYNQILSENHSQTANKNKFDLSDLENKKKKIDSSNKRDHDKNDLQCPTCGLVASSAASLKRHQTNKHTFSPVTVRSIKENIDQYVSSDGQMYRCDICVKTFNSKKVVKEHVRQHIVKQYMSEHRGSGAAQTNLSDRRKGKGDDSWESDDEVMLIDGDTPTKQNKFSDKHHDFSPCKPKGLESGSVGEQTLFELFENEGRTELSQNKNMKKSAVTNMRRKRREDEGSFISTSDQCFEADENSFREIGNQVNRTTDVESSDNPRNDIPLLLKFEYVCQLCFKSFATNMTASEHVLSHYAENSELKGQIPSAASQLVCEVCGQTFRSVQESESHKETHSQEERQRAQNMCLECKLTFTSKQLLMKHLSFHRQVYLKCPECSSFFIDHAYLNLHILRRRHFLCSCGQVFLTFQALHQHRRMKDC